MIQIDMEMPKRCAKCSFCIHQKTNDYGDFGECLLQRYKKVDCLVWSRDSSCPLKEQEPILDKIRAEIENDWQLKKSPCGPFSCGLRQAIKIIDKYKAESEE